MSRLEKRLLNQVGRASRDFDLLRPGDRIMACLSGGKDSYVMLHLLERIRRRVPFEFSIIAVNLDQGQPGFDQAVIADWCEANGFEYKMLRQDTYSVVLDKVPAGKTYCSLCSRLRRGILYDAAVDLGATKIALGHHRDDVIETLMLNMLYAGQIKAIAPWLRSDDGRNVVIRPLLYCHEEDIAAFAAQRAFPILPCDLCGSQGGLYRQRVKRLLAQLQEENPNVKGNLMTALTNVRPTHLMDPSLPGFPARYAERSSSKAITSAAEATP